MRALRPGRTPVLLGLLTVLLAGLAAAVSMPGTVPFPGPHRARAVVASLIGQRWDLFTGDARSIDLRAYLRRPGGWRALDVGSSSSLKGSAGFSRGPRTSFDELRLLEEAATRAGGRYRACDDSLDVCASAVPAVRIAPVFSRPYVCGEALLARQRTAPPRADRPMPLRLLRIDVTC